MQGVGCKLGPRRTFNKSGNALLDSRSTVAGTVSTDRTNTGEQLLCALNDVGLVAEAVDQDILLLEEQWVLENGENLAEKGEGLLVELLGVANVGTDDLVKRQRLVALGEEGTELLRLDGELAADSVLGVADTLVDGVDGEAHGRLESSGLTGVFLGVLLKQRRRRRRARTGLSLVEDVG